jgi:hypothetical protein
VQLRLKSAQPNGWEDGAYAITLRSFSDAPFKCTVNKPAHAGDSGVCDPTAPITMLESFYVGYSLECPAVSDGVATSSSSGCAGQRPDLLILERSQFVPPNSHYELTRDGEAVGSGDLELVYECNDLPQTAEPCDCNRAVTTIQL